MAQRRLSMRKTREILRLKYTADPGLRAIARSCQVSPTTVKRTLAAAEAAALTWPLPPDLSDTALEQRLFGERQVGGAAAGSPVDWERVALELKRKHVTLLLLWEEYRRDHPDGYGYSRWCELYAAWSGKHVEPALRRDCRAGEALYVDWAGSRIPYRENGEEREAHVFVGVLGASALVFADVFSDERLPNWIRAHVEAFAFLGGVPETVVPDNPKTAVSAACRYEPDLNHAYQELAEYYSTVVLPARVRKPRDKAHAENGVRNVGQRIIASLRHCQFMSLAEVREAVLEQRRVLNDRPFQKRQGCRRSLFEQVESSVLKPLPAQPMPIGEWRRARVYKDYHIELDRLCYSVPDRYIGEVVDVRLGDRTLEIFHGGLRLAVHPRRPENGRASTLPEHRTAAHRAYLERNADTFIAKAAAVGGNCARAVKTILQSFPHPEMAFRSCEGILRLGRQHGAQRLEVACLRCLESGTVRYRHIEQMLSNRMEHIGPPEPDPAPVNHPNLRGADYYGGITGRAP